MTVTVFCKKKKEKGIDLILSSQFTKPGTKTQPFLCRLK